MHVAVRVCVSTTSWIGCHNINITIDGVPYDGAIVTEIHSNPVVLIVIYFILATIGLFYAAVCLTFNVILRKRK